MSYEITPMRYQYDPLGTNPANLITAEPHLLTSGHLPFPTREGLFYVESIIIKKQGVETPLTKGVDYKFHGGDAYISAMTGKEVAAVVELTDKDYEGTVELTYQCVGGVEGRPYGVVNDLLEAIKLAVNDTTIEWSEDIKNIPSYFPPAPHRHPLESLEQLDLLVQAHREVFNALINRVPMVDSGQHLQEQIDRLLKVNASIRNDLNRISAVTGFIEEIEDLVDQLERFAYTATNEVSIEPGMTALIGSWDLNDVNAVYGGLVAKDKEGNEFDTTMFTVGCLLDGNPSHTYSGRLSSTDLFSIESVRVDEQLLVRIRAQGDIIVKLKMLMSI